MRKLFFGLAMLFLSQLSFGQAVNESAIIPVSVTLNAVSRLTIVSGGNIKFVFNSIDNYTNGFDGDAIALYRTTVSVSSSRDYSVALYSETANFLPTDDPGNTLAITQLDYRVEWTGAALNEPTTYQSTFTTMTNAAVNIIDNSTPGDGGIAGNGADNQFEIRWRIGTAANANTLGSFLTQGNIAADHYVANIFIELLN